VNLEVCVNKKLEKEMAAFWLVAPRSLIEEFTDVSEVLAASISNVTITTV
jgi:hypothetical protein